MNRVLTRLGFTAAAIVAGGTAIGYAQESGSMVIMVKDSAGNPVPGAKVSATSSTQIGGARVTTSDANGRARFGLLYPGQFEVVVNAQGYNSTSLKNIAVGIGQTATVELKLAKVAETTVEVVSSAATIDSQNVTTSTRLHSDTVDSLPTQRTYTDYLRLAPGVIASRDSGDNPAVAGSLSRDNTGAGGARNNTYILDGVDTTNPFTGGALSRFNAEIIQEQEVKTGGITADVAARGGGLVSNVVTKSGSNDWHGSFNYYLQNDSLVNNVRPGVKTKPSKFKSFDTAFTIGGPIIKDRLWFFTSVQKGVTTRDGAFKDTATPSPVSKNAEQDDVLGFFKTTFSLNQDNQIELSITNNKSKDVSLGFDYNIPSWDSDRDRTQRSLNARYDGTFGDWVVTAKLFDFKSDSKLDPKSDQGQVNIIFPDVAFNGLPAAGSLMNYQKQAGGLGWYTDTITKRKGFAIDITKFQLNLFGEHQFKIGIYSQTESRVGTLRNSGPEGDYENLAFGPTSLNNLTWSGLVSNYSGASWADDTYVPHALDVVRGSNPALNTYLNGLGAVVDPSGNTTTDYSAIPFQTLLPGSTNQLAQFRIVGLRYGRDAETKRKAFDYFLQDQWALPGNIWTAYLGIRFNKDSYYADDGTKLHTTELNVAPRLGLTYNHKGQNKLKIFANYGRYFEPIKLDMVNFAGSFVNARVEQMYVPYQGAVGTYNQNNWVTLRQRGGLETVDALMAPTLQSPYTDETRIGFEKDMGSGMIFEAIYTRRKDQRIVEDFDLGFYTSPSRLAAAATPLRLSRIIAVYGGDAAYWTEVFRSMAYPLSHFGLSSVPANVNYVLGNMIGAERNFNTISLAWRLSDTGHGWTSSFNYIQATSMGNSLSSGDADFQGDDVRLDPRLPWMNGKLNASVDNTWKGYISYRIKNGILKNFHLGGTATYVQGINYTRGLGLYGRILSGPFIDGFDAEPGSRRGPDYKQIDLRLKYEFSPTAKLKGEVFVDVFNATNRQTPTAVEESSNGILGEIPGFPVAWQAPRRFYLGARVTF